MRVRRLAPVLLLAGVRRAGGRRRLGNGPCVRGLELGEGDLHVSSRASDVAWWVQVVAHDGWGTTAELVVTRTWKGTASVRYARTLERNVTAQLDALHASSPRMGTP